MTLQIHSWHRCQWHKIQNFLVPNIAYFCQFALTTCYLPLSTITRIWMKVSTHLPNLSIISYLYWYVSSRLSIEDEVQKLKNSVQLYRIFRALSIFRCLFGCIIELASPTYVQHLQYCLVVLCYQCLPRPPPPAPGDFHSISSPPSVSGLPEIFL